MCYRHMVLLSSFNPNACYLCLLSLFLFFTFKDEVNQIVTTNVRLKQVTLNIASHSFPHK